MAQETGTNSFFPDPASLSQRVRKQTLTAQPSKRNALLMSVRVTFKIGLRIFISFFKCLMHFPMGQPEKVRSGLPTELKGRFVQRPLCSVYRLKQTKSEIKSIRNYVQQFHLFCLKCAQDYTVQEEKCLHA